MSHLFATAVASARLRAHDRAALRAIGVTNGQIAVETLTATALSAVGALAVGLPVGWFVQRVLSDAITAGVGIGPGAGPGPGAESLTAFVVALVALAAVFETTAVALTGRERAAQLVRAD